MTVSATEYEAQVSAAIVAMAAACPSWQTACAGGVAEARAQIVEDYGGDGAICVDGTPIDAAKAWLIVRTRGVTETPIAYQTVARSGPAVLVVHSRADASDLEPDVLRRGKVLAGAIVRELRAQLGTAGALLYATFELGETSLLEIGSAGDADPTQPREIETEITITWSELP